MLHLLNLTADIDALLASSSQAHAGKMHLPCSLECGPWNAFKTGTSSPVAVEKAGPHWCKLQTVSTWILTSWKQLDPIWLTPCNDSAQDLTMGQEAVV